MWENKDRTVEYHLDDQDDLKFVLENYTRARTFSSFFPGIAGLTGIPLWCFYVNRGQAVCSFGTESKDGAIMEFQPANKAYRLVGTHGFRTFIKFDTEDREGFYEPFNESCANAGFDVHNRMTVSPYDLCLEETNETLGIKVRVEYFTVPEEPVAALARSVTITNCGGGTLRLELLDGMPAITSYGMWDLHMKNMSRTIEAWAMVENMEKKAPFYRLKVNAEDGPEVTQIMAGNFYAGFFHNGCKIRMLEPIIDPVWIFGHVSDLSYPFEFCKKGFRVPGPEEQIGTNQTGCAMGYAALELGAKESKTVYSLIGHAKTKSSLNSLITGYLNEDFFGRKAERNRRIIRELTDKSFVRSACKAFDSYSRQNFLDNVLRGGLPVSIEAGGRRDVFHAYSRRHGDPERDYNSFRLLPEYYSQGNGAYRDICQNRRNDAWFNPDTGISNVVYFLNLIQLDGYNPLVVKGNSYRYTGEAAVLSSLLQLEEGQASLLAKFLEKPFAPNTLLAFVHKEKLAPNLTAHELVSRVILHSIRHEEAEHGEGYWIDHWHYNLDLLESFETLFPDRMASLLGEERLLCFYEDEYYVLPRKERYVFINGRLGQYRSIGRDEWKKQLLAAREYDRYRVRTDNGRGEIFYASLWCKLLCICVNKLASLDAHGTGVEMEAGKPNWNDALNGLPGMFGSSVCETLELKRLILLLKGWLAKYGLLNGMLNVPVELGHFLSGLLGAIGEANASDAGIGVEGCHILWERSNSLKEQYREKIRYGLDGRETTLDAAYINQFLDEAFDLVERGIKKSYASDSGIYHAYFINEPEEYVISDREDGNSTVEVKRFKQLPLPPFLEAQVHALRVNRDADEAKKLYESVLRTELYDRELGMYRSNASLNAFPMEVGSIRAFTPGWLENESVFLHMEYKYFLELLKSGLEEEFYRTAATALVPFMNPEVYGRSIFENSSFIASSANPNKSIRGGGFVARLSGTTSEFYSMLLVMALGTQPFRLNENSEPELKLEPRLPGWMLAEKPGRTVIFSEGTDKELELGRDTYAFRFLGDVLLVYHNENRLNTYGADAVKTVKIILEQEGSERLEFKGDTIPAPYASYVRKGRYSRIDAFLAP